MLYSPLSIRYALNTLKEGASNNTFNEIKNLIGNKKIPKYENIDKNVTIADGLFIRDTFYDYVIPEYISTLKEKYDAEVIKDEFNDAKKANQWIEDKTLGIIKNMLDDNIFKDPSVVSVLLNTVAINLEWESPFGSSNTINFMFYKNNGEKVKVPTMNRNDIKNEAFSYYKDDYITVLNMDLKKVGDLQLEFMAIMPRMDLRIYIQKVTKEQIEEIDKNLISSRNTVNGINVQIPKFKFDYNLDLKNDLISLGVKDAFSETKADFSRMVSTNKSVYVSDILQKAFIEVNESGVKAAAATVGYMYFTSAHYPEEIYINRPFMFIIRDKKTKDIWFTGTLYDPQ